MPFLISPVINGRVKEQIFPFDPSAPVVFTKLKIEIVYLSNISHVNITSEIKSSDAVAAGVPELGVAFGGGYVFVFPEGPRGVLKGFPSVNYENLKGQIN